MATETSQNQTYDDTGLPSQESNPDVKAAGDNQSTNSTTEASTVSNAGTTVAGKAGSSELKQGKSPTVRPNPLGYLASYTYQLSLYMMTPDALNAFRAGGRKNISNLTALSSNGVSGGAYIIAQSGGINNTTSLRAPGMKLDYYIDNLQIKHVVSPNENLAPTTATRLSFNITEPYGFSFLSKLKLASDTLEEYSRTLNIKQLNNASRQFFVLGIRFLGYDKHGKSLTGKETFDGKILDPTGTGGGLFETFYEIVFKKVNFKIDGKATVYNIEAVSLNTDSLSVKNATIPTQVSIEAGTVDEALQGENGLFTLINNYYQDRKLDLTPTYKVEFIGDFNDLKNASVVLAEDKTKWKWPIKRDPNDPTGDRAVANNTKRLFSFSNTPSMSIITAMEKIFTQSSFLSNALKVSYTNEPEPDPESQDDALIKPDVPKYLRWYNITTNTKILGYSTQLKDFVYETTYVVAPYETPIVLSTYAKQLPNYYGPVKRYEYWFTGKNTEVISYEQTNNNGYFLVSLDPSLDDNQLLQIATRPNFQQNTDHTGRLYAGSEAIGSITTNLYDPKSYSNAKMTILGDPDFLVQDSLNYDVATKAFNQFYAPNGTTVNPTGGQIFIEVDFKEGVDYNNNTGVMDINESILFWQYPESIKKLIKGVSFQIKFITSIFRGGKFTQELDMFINQLSEKTVTAGTSPGTSSSTRVDDPERENESLAETRRLARQGTGSSILTGGDTTSTNTGLKKDPPVSSNTAPAPTPDSTESPDNVPVTNTNSENDTDAGREI